MSMAKKTMSFYTKHEGVSEDAIKINQLWEKAIRKASKKIRNQYNIETIKEERQEVITELHNKGYKVFDLHVHTYMSDGHCGPEVVIDYAVEIGLDGIAITDHNAIRGAKLAQKHIGDMNYNIMLIPGEEITTKGKKHIVALWKEFPENKIKAAQTQIETIKKIHDLGGIAVAGHFTGRNAIVMSDTDVINELDAIEINARSTAGSDSVAKDFAESLGLVCTGGSDSHMVQSIGCGFTITKGKIENPSDLFELIKNGKTDVMVTPISVELLTYSEELLEDYNEGLLMFPRDYKNVFETVGPLNAIWERLIRKASKKIRKLYKIPPIREERQEIMQEIKGQGYKAYDLSIHTFISNGEESPQAVVDFAKEIGLDGLAITDLNAIRGAVAAMKYIRENNIELLLFPGEEISAQEGHVLAYWEDFPDKKIKAALTVEDTCNMIHDTGGIAVAAHPFGPHGVNDTALLVKYFDGVEISSRCTAGSDSFTKEFAESKGIPYTGGSNAHLIQSIGSGCTITKHDVKKSKDLYDLIINKKTDVMITPMWVEILNYFEELAEDYDEGAVFD